MKVLVFNCRKVLEINCRKLLVFTCFLEFDLPLEKCALILLTTRSNRYIDSLEINKCVIDIIDVEDKDAFGAFSGAHARRIISFIRNLPDSVTDLYVCCSKGGSRSTGCAAALMLMSGRSDRDVWRNPFYTPNTLVFKILCTESGIFMPGLFVQLRKWQNEFSFIMAQKRKHAGKYERWQILS